MKFPALFKRLVSQRLASGFFVIFYILFFLFYFAASVKAATPEPSPIPNTLPAGRQDLHNWTQNVMIEVMSALTCQIAGIDPINPKQGCIGIVDQQAGKLGFLPPPAGGSNGGGAIGAMGSMISILYTPPLHTGDYFQNLASNFGIVKSAHATTGFESLSPLMNIWSAFRNFVYLIFVIVFMVIGLAIMLRIKIDPRTVMSIQNQIPKIIIGIILVTFSFAIAGLLIDLMWLFIYLIYGLIAGVGDVAKFNPANLQGNNPFSAIDGLGGIGIVTHASGSVHNIIYSLLHDNPIGKIISFAIGSAFGFGAGNIGKVSQTLSTSVGLGAGILCEGGATIATGGPGALLAPLCLGIGQAIGGLITTAIGGAAGFILSDQVISILAGIIAFLVISIALLIALFRLWITLLMTYVYILLDVAMAPFWIIAGMVPGSPISFNGWIRDLSANLLAFPVTIGMFLLGKVFMDSFGKPSSTGHFVPPLIGNPGDTNAIGSLIGLGIILITPSMVNAIKAALKAPKTDLSGFFKAIGVGAGLPIRSIQSAAGIYGASKYDVFGEPAKASGRFGRIFQRFFR